MAGITCCGCGRRFADQGAHDQHQQGISGEEYCRNPASIIGLVAETTSEGQLWRRRLVTAWLASDTPADLQAAAARVGCPSQWAADHSALEVPLEAVPAIEQALYEVGVPTVTGELEVTP